jgi:signal transduction histidine kinase
MLDTINHSLSNLCHQFMMNSPLLVCFMDYDGNILELSNSFLDCTGFRREELTSVHSIVEGYQAQVEAGGEEGSIVKQITSCEHVANTNEKLVFIIKKDGTKLPGLLTSTFLGIVNDKRIFGISITKASNLVSSKENAIIAVDELRKKESLKDEFIAIASHELRTPIQPILGLALLATRGKISHEEAWKDVLKEARRLQQLANDILDVSRIETGSLTYRMEEANLAEILDSVINSISSGELASEINFHVNIDKEMRETNGRLDRSRVTQLFTNIIGNSVRFTCKGDVTIDAKVNHKKNRFEIAISDTGGGIPDSIFPNLFNKFITRSVGILERHGSGLGLFISKAIVKAHQGAIYAGNNDKGATFVIYLPIQGDYSGNSSTTV